MKIFIIKVTIPTPPPDRRTKEYREGTYSFDSKSKLLLQSYEFDSIEAANEYFKDVYGCEVFLLSGYKKYKRSFNRIRSRLRGQ